MPEVKVTFQEDGCLKKVSPAKFDAATTVGKLQHQLAKKLSQSVQNINIFVNKEGSAFMPTPDQTLGDLADIYGPANEGDGVAALNVIHSSKLYQG